MRIANLVLWFAGLALQSLLIFALFRRGLFRSFPVFTSLMAFYILRSALFYILSSFGPLSVHGDLYNFLSVTDLFLQILLVIEVAVRTSGLATQRKHGGWARAAVQLTVEGAIAAGIAYAIPEPMRVPVDRGVVFVMILMVLRVAWTVRHRISGFARWIATGFALYGLAVTAAAVAQSHAVAVRSTLAYAAASYAKAVVYLGVVIFWMLVLPRSFSLSARAESR